MPHNLSELGACGPLGITGTLKWLWLIGLLASMCWNRHAVCAALPAKHSPLNVPTAVLNAKNSVKYTNVTNVLATFACRC